MSKRRGRISLKKALEMRGLTDWEQVARLSNDDIVKAAANDPDSAVPTAEELAEFKPAKPHRKIDEEDENAPEQKKD